MEKIWIKCIAGVVGVFLISLLVFSGGEKKNNSVFAKMKTNESVEKIINDNKDKTIKENKKIDDKLIYLEFEKDNQVFSHFVNARSGEEKGFLDFVKKDKKEDFNNKISELLYLKYPKFIADVLVTDHGEKVYQMKENELMIYFQNFSIEPAITESLFLTVNYNEIKEDLDFAVSLNLNYENEDGYQFDKEKKTVVLSFDDGPSGEKTNQIVDILEQNKAHATFFMVGNKMNYGQSVIKNVLEKGNEIGSHSYDHKSMKRQKLANVISGEEKTNEIYRSITGEDLIYTRPPYGAINEKVKNGLDTIFITWNLDPEDWLHRDKQYIVDYVMENVSDGDMILMHDSYDSTVEAVEELLPKLYANGFQVVSVSDLVNLQGRTLEKNTVYRSFKRN